MAWITCIVLILASIISFSGALQHGNSNTSPSSNPHTDPDVYKQLLHLETTLDSVYKELLTLKEQNLQQQKASDELQRRQQQQDQMMESMNHTIQNLEASFQNVQSENGMLKEKLNSLNSSFCQQNNSNFDGITKELQLQAQNLSLSIMELNKSSSEDIQTLRNIITRREQEVPKNITSVVSSLKMNDRYLSLSLLDVQNNISALGSSLQQQQKTQTEQHQLTQAGIQNLQTRLETTVAFTAGVGASDNWAFSPGQTIIFPQVIYQVGSGYNPSTGIFTAPKAGLYLIFCTTVAFHDEIFWIKILINGSVKAGVMAYHPSSNTYVYPSASNLVVHQLQAGDRVWTQVYQGSQLYSNYPDTTFSVIMVNGFL
ncbi:multimerin-2-like [Saccostrea cucullata]|uniref:multimerin-2-like n=1 Tax=Saccostrea cuccullata TaxID=36930 RepID=UPI002ED057B0